MPYFIGFRFTSAAMLQPPWGAQASSDVAPVKPIWRTEWRLQELRDVP